MNFVDWKNWEEEEEEAQTSHFKGLLRVADLVESQ